MAYTIDPANRRIILDSASATAKSIYVAWVDWLAVSDNAKYLPAFRTAGGDDLGGGLSIPPYYFLLNGWRVRPMEANQTLVLDGNLFVDGGGDPIVPTLGVYNVLVKSVVPVQAQGIATSGSTGPSADDIAAAILAAAQITPIHSDVKKVNSVTIAGSGIPPTFNDDGVMTDPGDPWVPVA